MYDAIIVLFQLQWERFRQWAFIHSTTGRHGTTSRVTKKPERSRLVRQPREFLLATLSIASSLGRWPRTVPLTLIRINTRYPCNHEPQIEVHGTIGTPPDQGLSPTGGAASSKKFSFFVHTCKGMLHYSTS